MYNKKKELENICNRLKINNIDEIDYFAKYVEIEAYDGCNLNCTMCPLGKDIYEGKGSISMDLFNKLTEELSEYADWINLVCLSRNGEPLLNKYVHVMVKKLKDIKIKRVNFSTNLTALTEKRSYELIESGLDEIRFSLDGINKSTIEKIRKDINYDKVLDNAINFIKIRDHIGSPTPQIQVRLVEQILNRNEINKWKDFWLTKLRDTDMVASKVMHSWGNELKSYEGEVIKEKCNPCISPYSTLEILHDGTVPLCGCDYKPQVVLGNVNELSLKEIWNSVKFKKIRDLHSSGDRNNIPICVGCDIWDTNIVRTIHHSR